MKSQEHPHRLSTTQEVARVLNVTPRTIGRWADDGRIPVAARTDRILRFDLDEVLAALRPNPSDQEG